MGTHPKRSTRNMIRGMLLNYNFDTLALMLIYVSNEAVFLSGPARTRGPRFIPEVNIIIPSSSQRQGDEVSVASTQRTPSEVGSTAPSRKRKRYPLGASDSPALNTRSRIKDGTELSSQASPDSPPLSPLSLGSESGRRHISASQSGHMRPRTSSTSTSIPSPPPKSLPFRPYVSIPTIFSFHHHKSVTTDRVSGKKARPSSTTDSPVTRSHCPHRSWVLFDRDRPIFQSWIRHWCTFYVSLRALT